MHSQKCQVFTCVVPVRQLSKFKACEICPRVSLKKCKFHTPLLIWMQLDMNMVGFAQQRENCYHLNSVTCPPRQEKEWRCWNYFLFNILNASHWPVLRIPHGAFWLFWVERSARQQLKHEYNSRIGTVAFSLLPITPSFIKSYYHFGSVWTSPPALLPPGKRAHWGLKAACTLLGENVCHQNRVAATWYR